MIFNYFPMNIYYIFKTPFPSIDKTDILYERMTKHDTEMKTPHDEWRIFFQMKCLQCFTVNEYYIKHFLHISVFGISLVVSLTSPVLCADNFYVSKIFVTAQSIDYTFKVWTAEMLLIIQI